MLRPELCWILFIAPWLRMTGARTNLLLIMFDDLRPELSIYGRQHMITPNFERLAARSVVFENAFSQVAVCNPSRHSLISGLRPDTRRDYSFMFGLGKVPIIPTVLGQNGYDTYAAGKITHQMLTHPHIWNAGFFDKEWYKYQGIEARAMNSSVMPDKVKPESEFRDYEFASRGIEELKRLSSSGRNYMMALGFKLPHLALHVPYRYYAMYRNKTDAWALPRRALKFPSGVSELSYRCCALDIFHYMVKEGAQPSQNFYNLRRKGQMTRPFPRDARDEIMMTYCAGVSYVDTQLGRVLDVLDELELWSNLTVILTADHGMHNGEKGIWEKWTLFDEAAKVPLMISHPGSPFHGQRYPHPVELIDVFPTIMDLLQLPPIKHFDLRSVRGHAAGVLDGQSLAPVVLGQELYEHYRSGSSSRTVLHDAVSSRKASLSPAEIASRTMQQSILAAASVGMPKLQKDFALTQSLRCTQLATIPSKQRRSKSSSMHLAVPVNEYSRQHVWTHCGKGRPYEMEFSVLGYSLRTLEYRYSAYYPFDTNTWLANLTAEPYEEELFDHKNETLGDFTHRELHNLAYRSAYASVVHRMRRTLIELIISTRGQQQIAAVDR